MKISSRARVLLAVPVLAMVALLLMPSPVDPAAYQPPPASPLTGPLAANEDLEQAEILGAEVLSGAEDVDVDTEGRIYAGTVDGRIVRLVPDNGGFRSETFADTEGRPLGLAWDAAGNLLVADARKGLLSNFPGGQDL